MPHAPPFLVNLSPEGMRLISYCPVCESHENPIEARVIDETDQVHLLHIQCRQCRNSIVSLVCTDGPHMSAMGVITDCTADDVESFKGNFPLTANDTIDLAAALAQGDPACLLDESSRVG